MPLLPGHLGRRQRGSYAECYFEERNAAFGDWTRERTVSVADSVFAEVFRREQERLAGYGQGFTLGRTADDIRVSVACSERDWSAETTVRKPLGVAATASGRTNRRIDPDNLEIGATYETVREGVPLVRQPEASDPMASMGSMIDLPAGTRFSVFGRGTLHGISGYIVIAVLFEVPVSGWINPAALFGPGTLRRVEPEGPG